MRWCWIARLRPSCSRAAARNGLARGAPPVDVTVIKVAPRDASVTYEYVGQTQSSHQVQIRARVAGFWTSGSGTEGHDGPGPASRCSSRTRSPFRRSSTRPGALASSRRALQTANDNLAQVKPLAALEGAEPEGTSTTPPASSRRLPLRVQTAAANVETAKLNLSLHPHHVASDRAVELRLRAGRRYVNVENSLLTCVEQVDPVGQLRCRERAGGARRAEGRAPHCRPRTTTSSWCYRRQRLSEEGRVTFANADYDYHADWHFLLRATPPNPRARCVRQFVRACVQGAVRPGAILVPQQFVLQGATGTRDPRPTRTVRRSCATSRSVPWLFIDRPIFSAVLAIISVVGLVAMVELPIAQYPQVAPPRSRSPRPIRRQRAAVAQNVGAPIEQQVNGANNMIYMSSTSSSTGNHARPSISPSTPTRRWRRWTCRTG